VASLKPAKAINMPMTKSMSPLFSPDPVAMQPCKLRLIVTMIKSNQNDGTLAGHIIYLPINLESKPSPRFFLFELLIVLPPPVSVNTWAIVENVSTSPSIEV